MFGTDKVVVKYTKLQQNPTFYYIYKIKIYLAGVAWEAFITRCIVYVSAGH